MPPRAGGTRGTGVSRCQAADCWHGDYQIIGSPYPVAGLQSRVSLFLKRNLWLRPPSACWSRNRASALRNRSSKTAQGPPSISDCDYLFWARVICEISSESLFRLEERSSESPAFRGGPSHCLELSFCIDNARRVTDSRSSLRLALAGGRHDAFQPHVNHQVAVVLQVV